MRAWSLWRWLLVLLTFAATQALATPSAPIPHLALDVELDPASRRLHVLATTTVQENSAEQRFSFALHRSLRITMASVDGRPVTLSAARPEGNLRAWQARLPAGSTTLHVEYKGTLPALDPRLDHREVLRRLPPMASVEGSFLPSGGGWYPQPAGLFRYRVRVSVPGDQRALVAGRLLDEEVPATPGDRYRASFDFVQPADGIDLMAGPWIVGEKLIPRDGSEALRLRTYFPRELVQTPGLSDSYLDETAAHIAHYAREIGAYPFSGFSVVASPLPTGFGMPTLTYLGAEVLKLPFIRASSLGHEILHNWWGNGVYVDYASGNWAEGLTTFMADYAYKERESADAAGAMRLGWLRDFAALPPASRQTLASFRSRTHGAAAAVGYGKSAMVFVMLRDLLGEQHFRTGLQTFWQQQRFRVASWNDLQRAFEQASGQSLDVFFSQWLSRDGAPDVRVTKAGASAGSDGGTRLTIDIEQSSPAYSLRLPIEVNYGDRWPSGVVNVELDRLRQSVSLPVVHLPQSVVLDPALRLWRELDPAQLPPILRQWIVARAPRLLQTSTLAEVRAAATTLVARVCEVAPREIGAADVRTAATPLLLVGLHAEVDAALAAAQLPARPQLAGEQGSAQVWTIAGRTGAPPVAVISARDADALRALQRPLPHYGSQSWLVFDGHRALARGVWPLGERALPVTGLPVGAARKQATR